MFKDYAARAIIKKKTKKRGNSLHQSRRIKNNKHDKHVICVLLSLSIPDVAGQRVCLIDPSGESTCVGMR